MKLRIIKRSQRGKEAQLDANIDFKYAFIQEREREREGEIFVVGAYAPIKS